MRQEYSVGDDVAESHKIVVLDRATQLLIVFHRNNLPVIICVIVRVSGDLLTLTGNPAVVVAQRVVVLMTVEVCLGLLVLYGDRIVVVHSDRVRQHDVVAQGLLELRSHKIIAWPRAVQDRKVDLEPEEVENEGHDDQPERTCRKVLSKIGHAQGSAGALHIQQVPQVDGHSGTNGDKGEQTDVFR